MKKKAFVISILAVLTVAFLLAIAIGRKGEKSLIAEGEKSPNVTTADFLVQGRIYEKEGKYHEARDSYWKAIEGSLDNEIIREAEKRIYDLNMKILFSPIITQDSQRYTIAKGDALSKIAKQFGTTVELLMKSNKLSSDRIKPGIELKISMARYSILVDRSQNLLILKSNDEILKTYQVSTGGEDKPTPLGNFTVVTKKKDPTWYPGGAVIPPDSPENILGSRWIGLSMPGYGIHGTTKPETVGKHITAGCIRMFNEEVEELYVIIPVGTEVTIVD